MIALRLLVLIAAAAQVSCAGTIERALLVDGFEYPFDFDREVHHPNVARYGECSYSPDSSRFLEHAVRVVDESELREIGRRYCRDAEAVVFRDPFVITRLAGEHEDAARLALHVSCYGKPPIRGLTGDAFEINNFHASALDSWFYSVHQGYWQLDNIAIFEVGADVTFRTLFETYDSGDDANRTSIIACSGCEWHDPIDALSCCGRVPSGTSRCGTGPGGLLGQTDQSSDKRIAQHAASTSNISAFTSPARCSEPTRRACDR